MLRAPRSRGARRRRRLGYCALALALVALTALMACSDEGRDTPPADTDGPDTVTPDTGGDTGNPVHTPPAALAALVDGAALTDRGSLDVVVETDRSGLVPGDFDEPIWQIGVTFRSQTFLGADWRHSATLVLPDDLSRADGAVAILQRSTPNPVTDVSDSANFLPQYAAITADRLDMPVLLLGDVPPVVDLRGDATLSAFAGELPDCFAGPLGSERDFADCLFDLTQASGRVELFPALPVAVTYVRAVTLMEELAELVPTVNLSFDPPVFRATEAALMGSGLDGLALRYAMALDGRIAGVMAASADVGNFDDFFIAQQEAWSSDFAYGDPSSRLAYFETSSGEALLDAFDLVRVAIALRGRTYLAVLNTNDSLGPLGLYTDYGVLLPTDRRALYIAGAPEGIGTLDHLFGWRVFLAHVFRGRPWAEVDSTFVDDGGNIRVTASVSGNTLLQTVELFHVQRHSQVDDGDFRDAVWQRQAMTDNGDGTYTASFPNTAANTAFFVRIFDSQDIHEGPMTGPLHRL